MKNNGRDKAIRNRLELLIARAAVRHELDAAPVSKASNVVAFLPLAAASSAGQIYGEMSADGDSLLRISFAEGRSVIATRVWSIGFSRTNAIRNKQARLITEDGLVDFAFRFDGNGSAEFELEKKPEIEAAIAKGFGIEIFDD